MILAVAHCHQQSIVHRDIRPENILVKTIDRDNFEVKLSGFGLAASLTAGEKLTRLVGSPYYVAPEVLLRSYDHGCDVWSCGVIIHIMLLGYPPFDSQQDDDIVRKVLNSVEKTEGQLDFK